MQTIRLNQDSISDMEKLVSPVMSSFKESVVKSNGKR